MAKILVVTDSAAQPLWEEEFKRCLGDLYESQQIRYLAPRLTGPTVIPYSTKPIQGVREVRGDPEQLKNEICDTEILVVEFAPVTEDVLEAGKRVKLIASTRGGPINVDIKAAAKRGIPVTHTQGRLAQPVADHTMGMLLSEARNIARAYAAVKNGSYFSVPDYRATWRRFVPELEGKTLGIVGFGSIGREVAKRAAGFGMKIIAYDPYVNKEDAEKFNVKLTTLESLMTESDFITIHAREAPETFHLIGKTQLNLMKSTAFLINTARGSLVDERALYEVLRERKIAGAAIDVFEVEPLRANNILIELDNVTITPHIAGAGDRNRERSIHLTTIIVAKYIKEEKLTSLDIVDSK